MEENRNPPKKYKNFHPFKFPHISSTEFKSNTLRLKKQKHQLDYSSMEETVSLILEGCKSARDLESNLQNLSKQPHLLFNSCDQIVKIFDIAKKRLRSSLSMRVRDDDDEPVHEQQQAQQSVQIDAGLQEWLHSNYSQAMDIIQTQLLAKRSSNVDANRMNSNAADDNDQFHGGGNLNIPAGRNPAGPSRLRKRRENMDVRIERMDAPRIGNTEIPPEDGFTWRKYGQKEIMGSSFPRGYYRCTHQKLYQCPAKKQVQRLDDDPSKFEIIYCGSHTCHMSATAPSSLPPPPEITHDMSQAMTITSTSASASASTSTSTGTFGRSWLSMDFGRGSTGIMDIDDGGGRGSGGAGTSTGRYGSNKEVDHQFPVIDMADVMFNSGGSSSNNSMDFIFPSMEDAKWNSAEDKKDHRRSI